MLQYPRDNKKRGAERAPRNMLLLGALCGVVQPMDVCLCCKTLRRKSSVARFPRG